MDLRGVTQAYAGNAIASNQFLLTDHENLSQKLKSYNTKGEGHTERSTNQ